MMNLKLVLLITFGLLNSQVLAKPGLTPPDGIDEFASHQAQAMETPCEDLDDTCIGCLSNEVSTQGPRFVAQDQEVRLSR